MSSAPNLAVQHQNTTKVLLEDTDSRHEIDTTCECRFLLDKALNACNDVFVHRKTTSRGGWATPRLWAGLKSATTPAVFCLPPRAPSQKTKRVTLPWQRIGATKRLRVSSGVLGLGPSSNPEGPQSAEQALYAERSLLRAEVH